MMSAIADMLHPVGSFEEHSGARRPYIPAMIKELRTKDLLEPDQGAQVLRVARPEDTRLQCPLLAQSAGNEVKIRLLLSHKPRS